MRDGVAWLLATAAGEIVGFGLVGALAVPFFARGEPSTAALLTFAALAGLLEGTTLATFQHRVLRCRVPVPRAVWVVATVVPASLAYAIGTTVFPAVGGATAPLAWRLAAVGALALALAALLAVGQALALSRYARRSGLWVPANVAGWAVGVLLAVVAIGVVPDAAPAAARVAAAVVGGAAMGLAVGAVSAPAFVRLAPR